jgi:hypothetical protein
VVTSDSRNTSSRGIHISTRQQQQLQNDGQVK